MRTPKSNKMLEYRLMDALEMNYSKDQGKLQAVKEKLLDRPIKDSNLYPLPSFILEDALVVIQDGHLKHVKQLYLLNSHRASFQTFEVNSKEAVLRRTISASVPVQKVQQAKKSKRD